MIVVLMKKLPDDSLKRRWADRAGDLIREKGKVDYKDFVDFIRKIAGRINNRYGFELRTGTTATTDKDRKEKKK